MFLIKQNNGYVKIEQESSAKYKEVESNHTRAPRGL